MSKDRPPLESFDGRERSFAIVAANYNSDLVNSLVTGVMAELEENKVEKENIIVYRVPGSNEIPYIAARCAELDNVDCVIALGVVIAGDTNHHDVIAHSTAIALQDITTKLGMPVINGIIVTNNRAQAEVRCVGELGRGREFAVSALIMAEHRQAFNDQIIESGLDFGQMFENMDTEGWDAVEDEDDSDDIWKK